MELERPLLRRLRNELRDAQALAAAGRVLRRRDVSREALESRLARAGVSAGSRARAVATLADAGALNDQRLAEQRAAFLADRGWGDEAIGARLQSEGLGADDVEAALAALDPETERAARAVAGMRDRRKAWNVLARRGFDPDVMAEAVATLDEGGSAGLG